jgi:DNA-binding MarR family transcriptional regulator
MSLDEEFPIDIETLRTNTALRVGILRASPTRIGFSFGVLSNVYFRFPTYRTIGQRHRLTEPETTVIFLLGHQPELTAAEISAISSRPKNSISRAVSLLMDKKLVTRDVDSEDSRKRILKLTPRGKEMCKSIFDVFRSNEKRMLEPLSVSEIRRLEELLGKLVGSR